MQQPFLDRDAGYATPSDQASRKSWRRAIESWPRQLQRPGKTVAMSDRRSPPRLSPENARVVADLRRAGQHVEDLIEALAEPELMPAPEIETKDAMLDDVRHSQPIFTSPQRHEGLAEHDADAAENPFAQTAADWRREINDLRRAVDMAAEVENWTAWGREVLAWVQHLSQRQETLLLTIGEEITKRRADIAGDLDLIDTIVEYQIASKKQLASLRDALAELHRSRDDEWRSGNQLASNRIARLEQAVAELRGDLTTARAAVAVHERDLNRAARLFAAGCGLAGFAEAR
jgi:hypothetical protein